MPKTVIGQNGSPTEVATMDDIASEEASLSADNITDATDTGKALLRASDGVAAMKSLENENGDIIVGKGMIFKADTITDEHIIEFQYAPHDGKADASIMANANAQGGAIALAVRGENDPAPVNVITLTAAGTRSVIIGNPDFALFVGKAQVDISNITAFAKSVVECATDEELRTLIGAGTSSLAIGTTATTAKAGNYQPTVADISDATAFGRQLMQCADADALKALLGI
ncbi:hypothetical protein MMB25_22655 [Salmonella enterica]|nr:hypothetical protein [Salmonella enterica]MCH5744703.1 hypothetical protein [Salmonella enterica]MCH5749662.1 hypothetical protein [Salmonella enterica]MCH5757154.1 hypothetical protein [Salmonella enterica]MCH5770159.1 hypothetical protein [Salmonella enterica]